MKLDGTREEIPALRKFDVDLLKTVRRITIKNDERKKTKQNKNHYYCVTHTFIFTLLSSARGKYSFRRPRNYSFILLTS